MCSGCYREKCNRSGCGINGAAAGWTRKDRFGEPGICAECWSFCKLVTGLTIVAATLTKDSCQDPNLHLLNSSFKQSALYNFALFFGEKIKCSSNNQ